MTTRLLPLLVVVFLLAAVLTTYPLCLHLAEAVPGDIGDPLLNAWILAWDAHALLADPLHLFDANIFFPEGNTLAYSEHLLGSALVGAPWMAASNNPLLMLNAIVLLSCVGCGVGTWGSGI